MQFIETSSFGVRAAAYHLRQADNPLEFVLFPMVHVGSRDYYTAVRNRLSDCDLIMAEGVDSRHASLLTLSCRVIGRIRQTDLVTQDFMGMGSLGSKVLHADMTGTEFEKGWRRIPLRARMALYIILPPYVLYMLLFGTKHAIAKYMELDDLPSRNEILYSNDPLIRDVDELVVDKRDARLIQQIEALHKEQAGQRKVVAIVYGAQHMRAITHFLVHRLKYHVSQSDWIVVFNY